MSLNLIRDTDEADTTKLHNWPLCADGRERMYFLMPATAGDAGAGAAAAA